MHVETIGVLRKRYESLEGKYHNAMTVASSYPPINSSYFLELLDVTKAFDTEIYIYIYMNDKNTGSVAIRFDLQLWINQNLRTENSRSRIHIIRFFPDKLSVLTPISQDTIFSLGAKYDISISRNLSLLFKIHQSGLAPHFTKLRNVFSTPHTTR